MIQDFNLRVMIECVVIIGIGLVGIQVVLDFVDVGLGVYLVIFEFFWVILFFVVVFLFF